MHKFVLRQFENRKVTKWYWMYHFYYFEPIWPVENGDSDAVDLKLVTICWCWFADADFVSNFRHQHGCYQENSFHLKYVAAQFIILVSIDSSDLRPVTFPILR